MSTPPLPSWSRVTKADLTRLLQRLATAYGRPFGSRAEDQVAEYYRVLSWASLETLTAAIDGWIATQVRWPVPAALAAAARQVDRTTRSPAASGEESDRCPGCATAYAWRTWLVPRRSPSDRRPVRVEYQTADGVLHPLVEAARSLCDCGYAAVLRIRAHHELAADPDNPYARAELHRRAAPHAAV